MSEVQKESYVDEAKSRIAHLSNKLEEADKRIKTLEYDNAELQKRDDELSARVKDMASKTPYKKHRYNNRVHH